jgi:hypothetical protein
MTTKKGCWFDRAGRGSQPVPRLLLPAIAMLIVAAITTGLAARGDFQGRDDDRDDEREGRSEYAIGLWGDLLTALRDQVIAFRKPVAYVHGDPHYFRVDKPLLDSQGRRLENFTRVETFGDSAGNGNNDVHWLKVLVDARSREVFAYEPQIVPGNRTAVPAP